MGECLGCKVCSSFQYEVSSCSQSADRVCSDCNLRPCNVGEYLQGCGNGSAGTCTQCHRCLSNQFVTSNCTKFQNTNCSDCRACSGTQYEYSACSLYSNRVCHECSEIQCPPGTYLAGCGNGSKGTCWEFPSVVSVTPSSGCSGRSFVARIVIRSPQIEDLPITRVSSPSMNTTALSPQYDTSKQIISLDVVIESGPSLMGVYGIDVMLCQHSPCVRNTSFLVELISQTAVTLIDSFPSSGYRFSYTPYIVRLSNVPAGLTATAVRIVISPTNESIDASSVTYEASPFCSNLATIQFLLPPMSASAAVRPTIIGSLSRRSSTFRLELQEFQYIAAPSVEVASMFPTTGGVSQPVRIQISIQNFPETDAAGNGCTDVGVLFVSASLTNATSLSGRLESCQRQKASYMLGPMTVDVSSPSGDSVSPGYANVIVYHKRYSTSMVNVKNTDAKATFDSFLFFNDRKARIYLILNEYGDTGVNTIRAKGSTTTRVSLFIENIDSSVMPSEYTIMVGKYRYRNNCTSYSDCFPVLLQMSCDTACRPYVSNCFTVSYYDDREPYVQYVSSSQGPDTGGNSIDIGIANFPLVTTKNLIIQIAGKNQSTSNWLLLRSVIEVTEVRVFPSPFDLGSNAQQIVEVRILPTSNLLKAVRFNYTYIASPQQLNSVSATSGPSTGCQAIKVEIGYFRYPTAIESCIDVPSQCLTVQFGSTILTDAPAATTCDRLAGTVSISKLSSRLSCVLNIITPATAPGEVAVVMKATGCGASCQQSRFSFFQQDMSVLGIVNPIPTQGSAQSASLYEDIYLVNFPWETYSALTAGVKGSVTMAASIDSPPSRVDDKVTRIRVKLPAYPALEHVLVSINVTSGSLVKSVNFDYTFFDGFALRILSMNPDGVPVSTSVFGRTLAYRTEVTLLLANCPQDLKAGQLNVTVNGYTSQVVSLSNEATCQPGVPDCNRTRLKVLLTPLSSLGNATVKLMVWNGSGVSSYLRSVATYLPCNYETFCSLQEVPDVLLLQGVSAAQCNAQFCVKQVLVPDASILSVNQTVGVATGGNKVLVEFSNFPSLQPADIEIMLRIPGIQLIVATESLSLARGSSLQGSTGSLVMTIPSVRIDEDQLATVTLTLTLGSAIRTASFQYQYLRLLSGNATVRSFSPMSIMRTDDLTLQAELVNVPQLKVPYNASSILYSLASSSLSQQSMPTSTIFASNSKSTNLLIRVAAPKSGWSVGLISISVCYRASLEVCALYGLGAKDCTGEVLCARGAKMQITVQDTPPPRLMRFYPTSGPTDVNTAVQFTVAYLRPGTSVTELNVSLHTTQNEVKMVSVVSISLKNPSCLYPECAVHDVDILMPALQGYVGIAQVTVTYQYKTVSFDFQYVASNAPKIRLFQPSSQYICKQPSSVSCQAQSSRASILVENFMPPCASSQCTAEQAGITITFTVRSVSSSPASVVLGVVNGLLQLSFVVPPSFLPGACSVEIANGTKKVQYNDFAYLIPQAQVDPVDCPVDGGIQMNVSAWGLLPSPGNLSVSVQSTQIVGWTLRQYSSPWNYVYLSYVAPAAQSIGSAIGVVGNGYDLSSAKFYFDYVNRPAISSLVPNVATSQGRTYPSLVGDQAYMTTLTIVNFPIVKSPAEVSLKFGSVECQCVLPSCSLYCGIVRLTSTSAYTEMQIVVPPASAVLGGMNSGQTSVSVRQVNTGALRGFIREASTSFTYYKPTPAVKLVRFCRTCNPGSMCIVNGVCGNGKSPQTGYVTWSDLQQSNGNIVEVAVENIEDWIAVSIAKDGTFVGSAGFVVTFGSDEGVVDASSGLRSVTVVDAHSAIFQTKIPAIQGIGSIACTVSLRTSESSMLSWTVAFQMQVVDDRRELKCVSRSCVASVTNPSPLIASIKNIPLTTRSAAQDQLVIMIGSLRADFTVVSCNTTMIIISVNPPEYTCSACTVSAGSSTVTFQATMRSDPSIVARTDFVYWASPKVTRASFDSTAAFITVTLDQATDGRSLVQASGSSCDGFVGSEAGLLGQTAPRCVWTTDQAFNIFLSPGATVLPSSLITVRGIRSVNQVSMPMLAAVRVEKPLSPLYPSVQISAPQEVDPCSPLTVRALAKSARQLSYTWRCLNDDGLNTFLASLLPSTSIIQFEAGVAEMASTGKTYTIGVTVKDFLGFSSKEAVTSITKKAFPSPTVVFTPQSPLSTFVDQDVTITATAVFSSCPVAKNDMIFQWSQSSGVAVSTSYVPSSMSQLWIPKYELQAGNTYTFDVSVSLQGDSSVSTTASFTLTIGNLPLMGAIAGGDLIQMSEVSELRLDASSSRDFDVKKGVDQGLTYDWSCYFSDGTFSMPCLNKNQQLLELPSGAQLVVPGGSLTDTGELFYTFSLVVSKGDKTPSTASKRVQVTKAFVPAVMLTSNVQTYDGAMGIVNQGDKLVYEASCPYPSALYVWTIAPAPNVGYDVGSVFPFGRNGAIFLMESGSSALSQGLTYSIAVECSVNGSVGTSSSSFLVNTPPQGGTCYACLVSDSGSCTKQGRPLLDEFVVTCANWIDPDTPLTYEFGFSYVQDGETITKWFQPTTLPYLIMRLPSSSAIQMNAIVSDGRGASTSVMQDTVKTVTTGRRLLQAASDWSSVTQDMSEKAQTQNVAGLNQLITSVSLELVAQLNANVTDLSHSRTLIMYMLSLLKPTYGSYPATTDFMSDALSTLESVGSELGLQSNTSVSQIVEQVDGLLQRYAGETVEGIMLHVLKIFGVAMKWMETGSYTDGPILDRVTSNTAAVTEGFSVSLATGQSVQYVQQYSSHRLVADNVEGVVGGKSVLDVPPGLMGMFQAKNASFRYSSGQTGVTGRVTVGAHMYGAVSGPVNGSTPLTPLIGVSMSVSNPISQVSIVMPVSRTAVVTASQSVLVARCVRWSNGGFEDSGCSVEGVDLTAGTVTCRCSVGVPGARRRLAQQPATFQGVTVIAVGEFQTYDCELMSKNCTGGQYLSGCGNGSRGECLTCSTCTQSEYMLTDCSPSANRRCAACSQLYCNQDYRRSACGGGGRGSCVACTRCGANQRQLVSCGENSASQDAVCIDTADGTATGTKLLVLTGAVRVGSSLNENMRAKFILGLAAAAGVDSSSVNITYIREVHGARRALAVEYDVGYQVFLELNAEWKSVQSNLGSEKLLEALRGQGLQNVQILEYPTLSVITLGPSSSPTIIVAVPTSTVEPTSKFNFVTSAGFAVVVSIGGFVMLVAIFVFRRFRSSRKKLQVASFVFEPRQVDADERPPAIEGERAVVEDQVLTSGDESSVSEQEESQSESHSQEAEMRDILCYADISHFNEGSSNESANSEFVHARQVQDESIHEGTPYLT
ncbi:hypothetical protein GUITHDRAFT_110005 [Guillardia theta CCMP2712]|uniref:TNFR-Cys domain-containing protein n=2 Tax=Guillardia theta TaxID=55529 RepID=L1J5V9_GUITC|nr:hypothetical protein GUITHDRAFT_110005 [Guillardia theta CCMP2712]EKX43886.1 hypothetical protein GUITHDRAFT_110005 [Guillardia theta CCMP2712]|eukprot:XP_005830866.1 hypothetical protein GUITHDRAFT_110005 [Guillardia theta CCMP2712]